MRQRAASTFRIDRARFAGETVHTNNPLGGLGLNSGVHDAVRLADKREPIGRGEASDDALNLYDRKRRLTASCKDTPTSSSNWSRLA